MIAGLSRFRRPTRMIRTNAWSFSFYEFFFSFYQINEVYKNANKCNEMVKNKIRHVVVLFLV